MTTKITRDELLNEMLRGSGIWYVNEFSEDAANELVAIGYAEIEKVVELYGRRRGGREFARIFNVLRLTAVARSVDEVIAGLKVN